MAAGTQRTATVPQLPSQYDPRFVRYKITPTQYFTQEPYVQETLETLSHDRSGIFGPDQKSLRLWRTLTKEGHTNPQAPFIWDEAGKRYLAYPESAPCEMESFNSLSFYLHCLPENISGIHDMSQLRPIEAVYEKEETSKVETTVTNTLTAAMQMFADSLREALAKRPQDIHITKSTTYRFNGNGDVVFHLDYLNATASPGDVAQVSITDKDGDGRIDALRGSFAGTSGTFSIHLRSSYTESLLVYFDPFLQKLRPTDFEYSFVEDAIGSNKPSYKVSIGVYYGDCIKAGEPLFTLIPAEFKGNNKVVKAGADLCRPARTNEDSEAWEHSPPYIVRLTPQTTPH